MGEEAGSRRSITVTVRLVKNFQYRSVKNLVLHDVDVNWTTEDLKHKLNEGMPTLETSAQDSTKLVELQARADLAPFKNIDYGLISQRYNT